MPHNSNLNLYHCNLPLKSAEARAFFLLDQFLHPGEWSERAWEELNGDFILCALSNGTDHPVTGSLLGTKPMVNEVGHLLKIVIHPEFRHQGGATLLLKSYLDHLKAIGARSLYLEVAVNNIDAISFYRKHGLKVLCVKKRFYNNGEDALSMELLFL